MFDEVYAENLYMWQKKALGSYNYTGDNESSSVLYNSNYLCSFS